MAIKNFIAKHQHYNLSKQGFESIPLEAAAEIVPWKNWHRPNIAHKKTTQ